MLPRVLAPSALPGIRRSLLAGPGPRRPAAHKARRLRSGARSGWEGGCPQSLARLHAARSGRPFLRWLLCAGRRRCSAARSRPPARSAPPRPPWSARTSAPASASRLTRPSFRRARPPPGAAAVSAACTAQPSRPEMARPFLCPRCPAAGGGPVGRGGPGGAGQGGCPSPQPPGPCGGTPLRGAASSSHHCARGGAACRGGSEGCSPGSGPAPGSRRSAVWHGAGSGLCPGGAGAPRPGAAEFCGAALLLSAGGAVCSALPRDRG